MIEIAEQKQVLFYSDKNGVEPLTKCRYNLRDSTGRLRILARLKRLEQGNYGDCQPVGNGVSELRLFFGSGYRIYFAEEEYNIIILLCGGDKNSQSKDIEKAKEYWKEYLNHGKIQNN